MFEASRRDEWPFCAEEFELWPRHMRVPAPLQPLVMAFGPLGMVLGVVGSVVSAAGTIAAGDNAEAMGQFEQAQYAEQAKEHVAAGQRQMEEQNYKTKLVQSALQARAAGNGINPAIGSTNVLSQDIAGRGEYNSLLRLSTAQGEAAGYTNEGSAARYQGDLDQSLAPLKAFGTIAGGAGSFFQQGQKLSAWG